MKRPGLAGTGHLNSVPQLTVYPLPFMQAP